MEISKFWQLIDQARLESKGDVDKQANIMIDILTSLSTEEILDYDRTFATFLARADRGDLLDVAFVIGLYMSDSGSKDFRAWLIGQGQTVYENALHDPETLADVVGFEAREEIFAERLLYAADIAYKQKTGDYPPPYFVTEEPQTPKTNLHINASTHDDFNQRFAAKYPKVWEKFRDEHEA